MMDQIRKHLKSKRISDEVRTINALILLLKKSPKAIQNLSNIRINPEILKS